MGDRRFIVNNTAVTTVENLWKFPLWEWENRFLNSEWKLKLWKNKQHVLQNAFLQTERMYFLVSLSQTPENSSVLSWLAALTDPPSTHPPFNPFFLFSFLSFCFVFVVVLLSSSFHLCMYVSLIVLFCCCLLLCLLSPLSILLFSRWQHYWLHHELHLYVDIKRSTVIIIIITVIVMKCVHHNYRTLMVEWPCETMVATRDKYSENVPA